MGKPYQQENPKSTTVVVNPPIPKRFIARAREKRAAGQEYAHWVKAARIIHHIDLNIPVGFDRLRRGRKSRRGEGRAAA